MIITNTIERALRERLKATEGGIIAAAALGGISAITAHKILRFENVAQKSYDAFCEGLTQLESNEALQMEQNERKALAVA